MAPKSVVFSPDTVALRLYNRIRIPYGFPPLRSEKDGVGRASAFERKMAAGGEGPSDFLVGECCGNLLSAAVVSPRCFAAVRKEPPAAFSDGFSDRRRMFSQAPERGKGGLENLSVSTGGRGGGG